MEPRWRKRMYGPSLVYRGGTESFDIGLAEDGKTMFLWIIWSDKPFHWATFDKVTFHALEPGKWLEKGRRVTAKELRDLRNYVQLFVPEFAETTENNDAA